MVLDRLLREAGIQVQVAENGEQGVERFREWRPHFIWMDLRMPVMGIIAAMRHIRELEGGRDVKIAAVTASGFIGERGHVLAVGLDDYVPKPHRPDEIFECMARHLGVRCRRGVTLTASPGEPPAALRLEDLGPFRKSYGRNWQMP
jgi:CheY-like chemotaxis protein